MKNEQQKKDDVIILSEKLSSIVLKDETGMRKIKKECINTNIYEKFEKFISHHTCVHTNIYVAYISQNK